MQPIFNEAKKGKRKVSDAAHFVLASGLFVVFLSIIYQGTSRRKTFQCFGVGALDAITHQLITVTNDTYINSLSICEFSKLREQSTDMPITIILDNARYQKCQLVSEAKVFAGTYSQKLLPLNNKAAEFQIDLLYLPSYSPNLNLIERLWKFVKKKTLYSKYYAYADFDSFKKAISNCLAHTHDTYQTELDSLLT